MGKDREPSRGNPKKQDFLITFAPSKFRGQPGSKETVISGIPRRDGLPPDVEGLLAQIRETPSFKFPGRRNPKKR